MVSSQFHYTKRNRFMPFLLAEILNFQGSTHHIGVGSFSNLKFQILHMAINSLCAGSFCYHAYVFGKVLLWRSVYF